MLAFVAQQAVQTFGWLTATDMVRGLGLAETTPGPLIMVVQFVAFLGATPVPAVEPVARGGRRLAAAHVGDLRPELPVHLPRCPFIERLRGNRSLAGALTGITAAVVGVIANLALYFAVHTLFTATITLDAGPLALLLPVPDSLRPVPVVIAALAVLMVFALRWPVLRVLGISAGLGLAWGLLAPFAGLSPT